jgi:DNA mismatch repair protein MutS
VTTENDNLTPMMQQYSKIRKSLPRKTLLFFRLGDFYELFNEDAEIGAKLLGITLTHRGKIPMAGIPYHVSANYINKILGCGYKIAICDQVGTPTPGKLVPRSLSRILTPGTVIADQQTESRRNNYVVALSLFEYGIAVAWLEVSTGEFQMAVSQRHQDMFGVLFALDPREVVVAENSREKWKTMSAEIRDPVADLLRERTVSEVPEFYFDNEFGETLLKERFGVFSLEGYGVGIGEYYGLGPAGAVLRYAEENFCKKLQNIRALRAYRMSEFVQIDRSTIKNLEIFHASSMDKIGSLVTSIDLSATTAGSRQLEKFLREPSLDRDEIFMRQNCVRAFYEDKDLQAKVRSCLNGSYDLARVLTRLQNSMKNPRDLAAVADSLERFHALKSILENTKTPEFKKLASKICSLPALVSILKSALCEDLPPTDPSFGGYIRDGYNEELDKYRAMSKNCKTWFNDFENKEQLRSGIKNLKVKYSNNFGYFIEISKSNLCFTPGDYVRRQTTVNAERYVTDELRKKEEEIMLAQSIALELEEKIFNGLVERTLKHFDELRDSADVVARIDVFSGWGELARRWNYCCPEIVSEDCLEIIGGRHPMVEQISTGEKTTKFTHNNTEMSSSGTQIILITGPNMAGKSTYIRQVALITLMAHIGCWVPAKKCKLSLVDKIFSRIGSGDDLSRGRSTFMIEMSETANILNNATNSSLVILDEVGRGTSTYDGLSIAWSVVEYLHGNGNSGPKTLFATHYHELTKLSQSLVRLKNFQMEVKEWHGGMIFMRKVVEGAAGKSYGIHVARLAGVPQHVISRAEEVLKELEDNGNIFTKNIWHKKRDAENDSQRTLFEDCFPEN